MSAKIYGICKVDGCDRFIDALGYCNMHYQRQYKHGTIRKINRIGKASHPLIHIWRQRHGYGSLPPEWMDFWQFVQDVGERPSENHYLVKRDRTKPYSKDNFDWILHIKRQPNETDKEVAARKWKRQYDTKWRKPRKGKIQKEATENQKREIIQIKLKQQQSRCAICDQSEKLKINKNKKPVTIRLALDHCHKTNKIRDLLCWRCNLTLGKVEDSIILLEKMIIYLKKHS